MISLLKALAPSTAAVRFAPLIGGAAAAVSLTVLVDAKPAPSRPRPPPPPAAARSTSTRGRRTRWRAAAPRASSTADAPIRSPPPRRPSRPPATRTLRCQRPTTRSTYVGLGGRRLGTEYKDARLSRAVTEAGPLVVLVPDRGKYCSTTSQTVRATLKGIDRELPHVARLTSTKP